MYLDEIVILGEENSTMVWPLDRYFSTVTAGTKNSDAYEMDQLIEWADKNCEPNTWMWDGITRYSYKMFFANPLDALAFKIQFGI